LNLSSLKIIGYFLNRIGPKNLSLLVLFTIVATLLEIAGIGLMIPLMSVFLEDSILNQNQTFINFLIYLGNPSQDTQLTIFLNLIFIVFTLKLFFLIINIWFKNKLVFNLSNKLSSQLFELYLNQSYEKYIQKNSAELMRNTIESVENLVGNIILPSIILLAETLILLSIIIFLLFFEPLGTIAVISTITIGMLFINFFLNKRILLWGMERNKYAGLRIKGMMQGLNSIKELIILGKQKKFLDEFKDYNLKTVNAVRKQSTSLEIPRIWLEYLVIISLIVIIYTMIQTNQPMILIISKLGVFAIAAIRLLPSSTRIFHSLQCINFGLVAANIVYSEIKEHEVKISKRDENSEVLKLEDTISLKNIFYKYPLVNKNSYVIENFSLNIQKRTIIGVIGSTGSGKSTLIDIILGLIYPSKGTVNVDGLDIHSNLRAWQNNIGYVPQNIYLSDDSIKNNIAYGVNINEIDEGKVKKAVKIAQLNEFIKSSENNIETFVGENGINLSGGQRQRIGIARALYNDPEIIIFDEATSALDVDTEKKIMDIIFELKNKKTIIIVSHRINDKREFDKIYNIKDGKLILIH